MIFMTILIYTEVETMKRLYKSTTNKMLCGVCGGIAEYFNMDPTIIRLITALICAAAGTGILVYIVLAIVMPNDVEIR